MRARVLVLVLFAAPYAWADVSALDKAHADALFREGRELMGAADYARACGKFAESQRLDPAPGTLVNLALCHEKEGKTASAWAEFNEVADRPGEDRARAPFARTRAQDLERRLSRLRVTVASAAASEEVTIDGRAHGASAWGSALPLDPGEHVVEAAAPGKARWRKAVQVPSGPSVVELAVPALDDAVAQAAAAARDQGRETPTPARAPASTRPLGFVVAGAGVAALAVGTYFGLRTLSKKSDADALCPDNRCAGDPRVADLDDTARTSALVSTLAFAAGIGAVATGLYLVVTSPSRPGGSGVAVAPLFGDHAGGARVLGRF